MEKPWLPILIFAGFMAVLVGVRHCSQNTRDNESSVPEPDLVHEFDVFGTRAVLQLWGERETCRHAAMAIEARLLALHKTINLFDDDSELVGLNRSAFKKPITCSDELWRLLNLARRAHDQTAGAFDVSVGPLMSLWGFHKRQKTYPDKSQVAKALEAVGLDKIRFDDDAKTVRFTHPDTYLDFGGLAKGYALDLAVEIAREHGIDTGILDLGGNIYCLENIPVGIKTYTIGIRDPQALNDLVQTVELRDQAVATSGNYENIVVLDGRRIHHIIDPRTGYPVANTASVTVIADQGWISDVFSTAIFVRGPEFVTHTQKIHPHTRVVIIQTPTHNNREILTFD